MADLHVPIRAGSDIAFLGGLVQLHPGERPGVPRIRAQLHERAGDHPRGLRGHRGPGRPVLGLEPGDGRVRQRDLAVRGRCSRAPGERATVSGEQAHGAHGIPLARATAARDGLRPPAPALRVPDPEAPLRPLHARRSWNRSAASPASRFRRGRRGAVRRTRAGAHVGARLRGGLDPAHRWRSVHPHRGDHPAAARATSGGPAAGSWPCAATRTSRAPPTSRRSTTSSPATSRCRAPSREPGLDRYVEANAPHTGCWGHLDAYIVSLLKAWWGEAATAENDFCFDHLPRIDGDHSIYSTFDRHAATARSRGSSSWARTRPWGRQLEAAPAGHDQARLAGGARPCGDRDGVLLAATGRRSRRASCGPRTSAPRCSSCRRPPTPRRTAASPTPSACSSGTTRRSSPRATAARSCGSSSTWAASIREKLAGSTEPRDRPLLDLTWDYPMSGPRRARRERGAAGDQRAATPEAAHAPGYGELRADGSTACGCWIYSGVFAGRGEPGRPPQARPRADLGRARVGLGVAAEPAHPLQPRVGRPARHARGPSASATCGGTRRPDAGPGEDVPDFGRRRRPTTSRRTDAPGPSALRGTEPVHHAGRRPGLAVRPHGRGRRAAARPTTSRTSRRPTTRSTASSATRRASATTGRRTATTPRPPSRRSEVFPYVITTYRLTEHHTAGGMSRTLPYLTELQPEFFCEVSPQLAAERGLEHGGWATIVTARSAIEARVLVTERMRPADESRAATMHQVGLPYHWGVDGPRDRRLRQRPVPARARPQRAHPGGQGGHLRHPPGRRPRGPALLELVERLPAPGRDRGDRT